MNQRLWRVYFCNAHSDQWWVRLLRPGFQHVVMWTWHEESQRAVVIDTGRNGIEIDVIDRHRLAEVEHHLMAELYATLVTIEIPDALQGSAFGPLHCGTVAAHLLGVKWWKALTPWRLYRTLTKETPR